MVKAVIMPKLGQSEETVKIVRWRKQVGDTVAKGDILFEIETDKAVLEVESFYTGTLLKIVAGEGVTVPVQTTVAFVGDPGEAVPEVTLPPAAPKKAEPARPSAAPLPQAGSGIERRVPTVSVTPAPSAVGAPIAAPAVVEPQLFRISPRAAKLAKESVVDPTPIV
ncbi:MAG TPA: biotin/lipoyl-containing protein, partial [Terriglobia bacterium]|nr:biotin/lipoyl-containing protein [Terriglobia bacterium]